MPQKLSERELVLIRREANDYFGVGTLGEEIIDKLLGHIEAVEAEFEQYRLESAQAHYQHGLMAGSEILRRDNQIDALKTAIGKAAEALPGVPFIYPVEAENAVLEAEDILRDVIEVLNENRA